MISFSIYLSLGTDDGPGSINIFTSKSIDVKYLQALYIRHPIIPLYNELIIRPLHVFEQSFHFDRLTMPELWGAALPIETFMSYNIAVHWLNIQETYRIYSSRLLCVIQNVDHFAFVKNIDTDNVQRARIMFDLLREGFYYLSEWNGLILRAIAWKLGNPCPQAHLDEIGADITSVSFEYEKLIKYNFTKVELKMLADLIGTIKSLAALLDRSKANIAPLISFHIHHEVQQLGLALLCLVFKHLYSTLFLFLSLSMYIICIYLSLSHTNMHTVQGTLLPILHRMDKRKKDSFLGLLNVRTLLADWTDSTEPLQDYKAYSRKMGRIEAIHPGLSLACTRLSH